MVPLYPEGEIKEMAMLLRGGNAWCEKCEVEFGSEVVPGRGLLAYHTRADEVKFNNAWKAKFSVCPLAGRYFRMPELVEDMAMNPIGHPGKPAAASGLALEAAAKLKAEQSSKWMPMIEHGPGRECPNEDAEPTGVTGLDPEEFLRLNPKSTLESFAHADAVSEHYAKMREERNAPAWPKTAEAEKSAALFRSFPDPGGLKVGDFATAARTGEWDGVGSDKICICGHRLDSHSDIRMDGIMVITGHCVACKKMFRNECAGFRTLKNSSSAPAVTTPTHVRVENSVLVAEVAAMVHQALMGYILTTDVADKLILALASEINGNVYGDWLTQSKFQQKPGNQLKTLTDEQLFGDPVQPHQRPVDIGGDGVPRVTEPLAQASVSAVDRIQDVTESVLARYPAASGGVAKPIEFGEERIRVDEF